MAKRSCPRCERRLPYAGRRCIHCGWTSGTPAEGGRRAARRGLLWAVALVVGLFAAGMAYQNAPALADWYAGFAARYLPATASSIAPTDTDTGAFFYCARQVSRKMNGEFSVETFPSLEDSRLTVLGRGRYHIESFVDEVREDGAQVRYSFSCTVHYERGRWALRELKLEPRLALQPGVATRLGVR